ncbi:MAG: hypothetical protein CV045_05635 [Cyanobacteria bacterium M5B4]|nr:MAG: hypothetical protein CV045_05635 [Cyanobacteria bacterium M5B4]
MNYPTLLREDGECIAEFRSTTESSLFGVAKQNDPSSLNPFSHSEFFLVPSPKQGEGFRKKLIFPQRKS